MWYAAGGIHALLVKLAVLGHVVEAMHFVILQPPLVSIVLMIVLVVVVATMSVIPIAHTMLIGLLWDVVRNHLKRWLAARIAVILIMAV
jgi:hypothetical protein